MKFKKLGIEILGAQIYIDYECKNPESIKQKILDMHKALKDANTRDSVPDNWKPGNDMNNIFDKMFK